MAGFSGTLTLDDVRAHSVLSHWIDAGSDTLELMDAIGGALRDNVIDRFEHGRAPDGTAWPKSRRAAQTGGQTLVDKGRLRGSITYEPERDEVTVGTNAIYAAIHQFGGVIKAKTAKGLSFTLPGFAAEGGQEGFVNVRSVTMPARPFVGIGPEDVDAIEDMTRAWMLAPVRGAVS